MWDGRSGMMSRDALMGLGDGEPPTIIGSSLDWAFLYKLISFKRILKMGWILHCFVHINYVIQNKIRIFFFSHDMYLPVGLNGVRARSFLNKLNSLLDILLRRQGKKWPTTEWFVQNYGIRTTTRTASLLLIQGCHIFIFALLKRVIISLAHHQK